MNQYVLISASLFGMLAIVFGALGAHKLKKILTTELLQSFETGVKYQMYHAIVLLIIGFNFTFKTPLDKWIVFLLIGGTILFSFSIYGLVLSTVNGKKIKILGPLTPIGGLLLVGGWALMIYRFVLV